MNFKWFAVMGPLISVLIVASCGRESEARTILVPEEAATISEAVAQARTGDVVLVSAGVYHESVTVDVPGITIRGIDRNTVILDGQDDLLNGVVVVANDVAVENLTVHSFLQNGVLFNGVDAADSNGESDQSSEYGAGDAVLRGYRVSFVTAYNNGLYGIYAFASTEGLIEHTYVSGHPDSGIYVGQCRPCNVVIREVTAESNAIGYYGTNASGGVYVIQSVFRDNRLGVAPNSQKAELLAPQQETFVVGNQILDNDNVMAPEVPEGFIGVGIAVGGGTENLIIRNRVTGNSIAGIALIALNDFLPARNQIRDNALTRNGTDLLFAADGADGAEGNCFSGNEFDKSIPESIEVVMACDSTSQLSDVPELEWEQGPQGPDYRTLPQPPPQPSMPSSWFENPGGSGVRPIIDIESIPLPS
jgi:hypothetical protein